MEQKKMIKPLESSFVSEIPVHADLREAFSKSVSWTLAGLIICFVVSVTVAIVLENTGFQHKRELIIGLITGIFFIGVVRLNPYRAKTKKFFEMYLKNAEVGATDKYFNDSVDTKKGIEEVLSKQKTFVIKKRKR